MEAKSLLLIAEKLCWGYWVQQGKSGKEEHPLAMSYWKLVCFYKLLQKIKLNLKIRNIFSEFEKIIIWIFFKLKIYYFKKKKIKNMKKYIKIIIFEI